MAFGTVDEKYIPFSEPQKPMAPNDLEEDFACLSTSTEATAESEASSGDEFIPSSSHSSKKERKNKALLTERVLSTLDHANLSDRRATKVLASTAKAFGHDLNDLNISHSSVNRYRKKNRKGVREKAIQEFLPPKHLCAHFDGKTIPDLSGAYGERLAVSVSGKKFFLICHKIQLFVYFLSESKQTADILFDGMGCKQTANFMSDRKYINS